MKPIRITLIFLSLIYFCSLSYGQIQPMGFTQKVVTPDISWRKYVPKLQLINDTLFVSSNTGVYMKNMKNNSDWLLYAFKDSPVIEFVRNGNQILANSMGAWNEQDSLLLFSSDKGKTFEDYTSSYFLKYNKNHLYRLHQNPKNPNSNLILSYIGLTKSVDFGKNWICLNEQSIGVNINFVSYHPLDTTTIFYSGETDNLGGKILKSSDNGETWSYYMVPGGDNCVHHIAFHPTNPDILIFGGEEIIGKSTDKGVSWKNIDLIYSGMYFYKVLFDEYNPNIIYTSGSRGGEGDTIFVYRSTDIGETWHLAYKETLNSDCGKVLDMVKYKNKLIFYTNDCGLFELDLETTPILSVQTTTMYDLTVYPNPVRNTLRFETAGAIRRIDIIDCLGRIIQKTVISDSEKSIDVSGLNSGIYFAVFQTDNQKIAKKICIKN
ncbi:MAG: T9SS type A sorting domain-containing protein [Dysgonomonas sp.]